MLSVVSKLLKRIDFSDEFDLAYLFGNHSYGLKHITDERFSGYVLRFLYYFAFVFKRLLRKSNNKKSSDVLFYAGTINQLNSLDILIDKITEKGFSASLCIEPNLIAECDKRDLKYFVVKLNFLDLFNILILNSLRFIYIFQRKKNIYNFSNVVDKFFIAHVYLVYFERLFRSCNFDFVVTSNDHNVSNRSLIDIAKSYQCKTFYLQHASVSKYFPKLYTDYALLDGYHAFEIYEQIIGKSKEKCTTKVFLIGQKKRFKHQIATGNKPIGLALNNLDSIKYVSELLITARDKLIPIKIRFHPSQKKSFKNELKSRFSEVSIITFQDTQSDSLDDFLYSIRFLIASDTNIHLEASLAGLFCVYIKFNTLTEYYDYYGFVENNICIEANNLLDAKEVYENRVRNCELRLFALKRYSETYGSKWFGKEAELFTEVLLNIKHNNINSRGVFKIKSKESSVCEVYGIYDE